MPGSEFWRIAVPSGAAGSAEGLAGRAEELGWDGVFFGDSQNVAPDAYVSLALAARVTDRIGLGTGVTNPVTRPAAVLAASAISVQAASGGRLVLGIGRGDSSVFQIGLTPMGVAEFSGYLEDLQGYLRGETVDARGYSSRIEWIDQVGVAKVPVSVAATGPKMVALAGRLAERVTFSVGADVERLELAIGQARQACREAGRDPRSLEMGCYVIAAPTEDMEAGRDLVRGIVSIHARFGAMHGRAVGGMDSRTHEATMRMVGVHTEEGHGKIDSPQAQALDDEFIDRFAVVGPPSYCAERIRALEDLGLGHFYLLCQGRQSDPDASERLYDTFSQKVIPLLR